MCGPFRQWNTVQHKKEMNYQAMKRHGGNLNAQCYVKEANSKRLHVKCHSNKMAFWKRQRFGDNEENSGCQGFRGERMLSIAEQRGFLGQ